MAWHCGRLRPPTKVLFIGHSLGAGTDKLVCWDRDRGPSCLKAIVSWISELCERKQFVRVSELDGFKTALTVFCETNCFSETSKVWALPLPAQKTWKLGVSAIAGAVARLGIEKVKLKKAQRCAKQNSVQPTVCAFFPSKSVPLLLGV